MASCALWAALATQVAPARCEDLASPPVDPWQNLIAPDRPGAATPPSVVGPGAFQIETSFESDRIRPPVDAAITTMSLPTLLRFGVGHRLELRLESNTASVQRTDGSPGSVSGFADVSVECKWLVLDSPGGATPSLAVFPVVSLPVGGAAFTAGKAQVTISALGGWTLPSGIGFTLDANVAQPVDDASQRYFWQAGSAGAFAIPLRRDLAFSGDVFVNEPAERGSNADFGADVAFEFYPDPDIQLDVVAGRTLSGPEDEGFVQIGFSRRWSPHRLRP